MPTQPTYPGVYIEEIPSGVRTITGVATSIAAFIGFFKRGPMNGAVQIFNLGDFEREFGGLDLLSEASYAIQQFFLNGGTQAHVIRVASGTPNASNVTIAATLTPGGAETMRIRAIHEGTWGDNIRIKIDHNTTAANAFNMVVSEYNDSGNVLRQEIWLNLSMVDSPQTNFVTDIINDDNTGSQIIRVDSITAGPAPAANGTVSDAHVDVLAITLADPITVFQIEVNGTLAGDVVLQAIPDTYSLAQLAVFLEDAIRTVDPTNRILSGAAVNVMDDHLQILAGSGPADTIIAFSEAVVGTTFSELLLDTSIPNLQEYMVGSNAATANANGATAQLDHGDAGDEEGSNGSVPDSAAIIGSLNLKTGMFALEDVDLFNIMSIPITGTEDDDTFDAAISAAIAYCEEKKAFFIIETPTGIDTMQEVKNWKAGKGSLIRSNNAALYFPRVLIPDPLDKFRLRSVGASGTVAGLYARTDSNRGVWKAPAGTEATLRGVSQLEYILSDRENGVLNPLAINSLRNFPVYGSICWGARTMEGADALASEWKYVPVRRLALFLEESLFRGTHWVVFEPNDEPLWAQIRLNVGAFMNNLFKQGAFQGTSPKDAYLVKCDRETTTQNDINLGIVNIVVGFSPLKPAEFVFIKIQQLAGQIET